MPTSRVGSGEKLTVIVCGSRDWTDRGAIQRELEYWKDQIGLVIDGVARGADTLGYYCALALKLPTRRFPADWNKHGRAAGYIRNQQMLDEGKPDLVIAFHKNESRGTADMIHRSGEAGVPVVMVWE